MSPICLSCLQTLVKWGNHIRAERDQFSKRQNIPKENRAHNSQSDNDGLQKEMFEKSTSKKLSVYIQFLDQTIRLPVQIMFVRRAYLSLHELWHKKNKLTNLKCKRNFILNTYSGRKGQKR